MCPPLQCSSLRSRGLSGLRPPVKVDGGNSIAFDGMDLLAALSHRMSAKRTIVNRLEAQGLNAGRRLLASSSMTIGAVVNARASDVKTEQPIL